VTGKADSSAGSVRHECVPLEAPQDWRSRLEGLRHGFAHTWESCFAMYLTSRAPTYLYCLSSPMGRAVCPLSERSSGGHTDIVTPYGFSGFTAAGTSFDPTTYLAEFAGTRGYVCAYLVTNPALQIDLDDTGKEAYRHIYVIDLRQSESELFSRLSNNRKRAVRALERGGVEVEWDRARPRQFVLAEYHPFMRGKHANPVYDFTIETLDYLLDLDRVLVIGAGSPKIEAVTIFGYTPFSADYLFNISVGDGRRWSVALIWAGMKRLKALGIPTLNLGGGVREGDGVASFKERFGARRVPLVAVKQIYQPTVFAELCRRAGADPLDPTAYFPPYRDPRLQLAGLDGVHPPSAPA